MKMLVGITGYAGPGKTTAAGSLMQNGYYRLRFADPIKEMVAILGLTSGQLDGDQKEEPTALLGGKSPRYAMQTLGTEWGRNLVSPTIWIDILRRRAQEMRVVGQPVVVDDVRFPNEAEAIKEVGGFLIRVVRPEQFLPIGMSHASEFSIGTLDVDHTIYNDSSIVELKKQVSDVVLPDYWRKNGYD